jgi:hypothetical protein
VNWDETRDFYLRTLTPSTANQYRIALDGFADLHRFTYAEKPEPASSPTRKHGSGGDLVTLRSILGHASITSTSRYLHPDAARMQKMVDEL